ncbi:hypothetical protein TWF506_001326 [Arthrobotrys conoides]|uniref:Bis(5'-adenosyl)-triphosphatase n=1 Tax=Arthrobotrys conoides TaxID=74498 RepID=A0AAN8NXU7_9PEZI
MQAMDSPAISCVETKVLGVFQPKDFRPNSTAARPRTKHATTFKVIELLGTISFNRHQVAMPTSDLFFGPFKVSTQVFYKTRLSMAIVNIKPILPGHVLVCPQRVVARYKDMTYEEIMDHALAVQKVARMIERVYGTTGATIAIQDGGSAGQSVPHVHTHIIPRKLDDFPSIDDVYTHLESPDSNVGRFLEVQRLRKAVEEQKKELVVESMDRTPRTMEEMEEETRMLASEIEKETGSKL